MASYGHRTPRPALKNGVDIQLQAAFAEENWTTVIRLADKRLKSSSDSYYEVIKVCAESKLDGMAEKSAAAAAVDVWVQKGTAPKDLEAIELFEWACAEAQLPLDYSRSFGALRLRWVKASPRNVAGGLACLRECLLHWDLENAQQIANALDKSSNANDRRFMFWSILLTHMLSTSPMCPAAKQKIYGMLAQKQLEKAAESAEANGVNTAAPSGTDRSLHAEEEFLLYFRVLADHGTPDNFLQHALNPHAGAVQQFVSLGRKQLFLEALSTLESAGKWDAVFGLCRQALGGGKVGSSSAPFLPACDLRIWQSFIAAARQQSRVERAFDDVQGLLNRFTTPDTKLSPMYAKNVSLALLKTVFSMPPALLPESSVDNGSLSPRVEQLLVFIDANLEKASLFGDIKRLLEQLTFAEDKSLLDQLASPPKENGNESSRGVLRQVLVFKLRYLVAANTAKTLWPKVVDQSGGGAFEGPTTFELACKFCGQAARAASTGCTSCLNAIATGSLQLHSKISADQDFVASISRLDKDPRIDLTLVAVSCLLRLSGLHGRQRGKRQHFSPTDLDPTRLLQAALLLDTQQQLTPNDVPVRLLLLRLSLLLGYSSSSHVVSRLWNPLGVKRTILDALGPIFYDRLSTVSPGLFTGSKLLMEPLRSYYDTVLKYPSPVKIWDAFTSGSYSSILDMALFHTRLQHSCTRAMAVVEERRAARAFGAKLEDVEDQPIFGEITNDVELVNATDYGSIPNLENSDSPSLAEVVSLGPELSNTRMHLGLLAEQYLDLINFKPAKEYKPAKPGAAAAYERSFLAESFVRLHSSLQDFLQYPSAGVKLTSGEFAYYTIVSLLAGFAAFGMAADPSDASFGPGTDAPGLLTQPLTAMLNLLRSSIRTRSPSETSALLHAFTNLHNVGMLRDAAMATKQTAAFLTTFHEKETARDRTGKSGLSKETLAELRIYKMLSSQASADVKAHIKSFKERLGESGWLDRIGDTVTVEGSGVEDALSRAVVDAVGGSAAVEDWVGNLLDGWRDNIRGWGMVQLE